MKDADIDYSDIPRLDKTFFTKTTTARPPAKKQLTIRRRPGEIGRHGGGQQ